MQKADLWQDSVHGRDADEAAHERHPAEQEQVVVVRRRLYEVEFGELRHLGGDRVVEVEQDGDEDGRNQGARDVGPGNVAHALQM